MTTPLPRSRATSAALSIALIAGGVTALAGVASAAPVGGALLYGLTADNGLVMIRTGSGVTGVAKPISGLDTGDALVGIDVRSANGVLYAVSKGSAAGDDNLYAIAPSTGAATKVGSPLTTRLAGTSFGVDINPVADAVRVVSDTGQNLAVNVTTGAVTNQTALSRSGLFASAPAVNGAAYTPPVSGATTLFDLDVTSNRLYTQEPASGALTTVGSLTATAPTGRAGFDIDSLSGTGYASLTVGGTTGLYAVALPTTGVALDILAQPQATQIGAFSLGNVVDIAAAPSRVGFADQDFTVPEAGGTAAITVTRLGDSSEPASAAYATSNGTATAGQDYDAVSGTVTFPANATTATISVPITDNTVADSDKTFGITLSAPSGTTLLADTSTVVTIANDDAGALLYALTDNDRLATLRVASGIVGTPQTITGLAAGDNVVGIDVRPLTGELYAVADGTSVDKIYTVNPASGVATKVADLTVALSGASFATDFNPVADRLRIISNTGQNLRVVPSGATAGAVTVDTTLTYSGGTPATTDVRGAAYTNSVGNAGSTQLYDIDTTADTLSLTADPNSGVLSTFSPLGVNASGEAGFDIDAATGFGYASLTVAGVTKLYAIALPTLVNPANAATPIGTYTLPGIEDITAATPRLSVAGVSVAEGATATVTVSRTGDVTGPATVAYATSNGTATAGADYTAASGTLTFAANQSSKTFSVVTTADSVTEDPETVIVTLSAPSAGNVLGTASAAVTITNSATSVVSLTLGPALVNENAGTVTVPVTRTNPTLAGTVSYATANGGARAGQDYVAASGTVAFAAGEATKNIVITLLDDTLVEGNESFGVFLSNPSTGLVIGQAQAVITTVSDDVKQKTSISQQVTSAIRSPGQATIAGRLVGPTGAGLGGRTVYIVYAPRSNPGQLAITRILVTQPNGLFSTMVRPTVHTLFTAVYNGNSQDLGAASSVSTTFVAFSNPTVTGQTTIRRGSTATFKGVVSPGNSRPAVRLQYLKGGRWTDLTGNVICRQDGTYALSRFYSNKGTFTLRVVAPGTARNNGAVSRSFVLKVI